MFKTRTLTTFYAGILLSVNSIASDGPGTLRGRVDAVVVDNFQVGTSRTRFFLRTGTESLELQGVEGSGLRGGQTVEVTGQVSGRKLAVAHVAAADAEAAPAACTATGEQKAAIILVSFPSKALLSSVTPALVKASFFGTGRTVDTFLRESSYGQTSLTGDVLGPYVLAADYFDEPFAVLDAAIQAAAPFANLTEYNRIFVVAPQGQTGLDSGGMALLGCGCLYFSPWPIEF